jgi:hypothetical protein
VYGSAKQFYSGAKDKNSTIGGVMTSISNLVSVDGPCNILAVCQRLRATPTTAAVRSSEKLAHSQNTIRRINPAIFNPTCANYFVLNPFLTFVPIRISELSNSVEPP